MTVGEGVAVSVAVSSLIGSLWGASRFVRGIEARQDAADDRMASHERLCGERYSRIEQIQAGHVQRSNERHQENVDHLEKLDERFDRLDDKLDRVLEAR